MKERRDAIFEKKDGKTRISVFEFKGIADKRIEENIERQDLINLKDSIRGIFATMDPKIKDTIIDRFVFCDKILSGEELVQLVTSSGKCFSAKAVMEWHSKFPLNLEYHLMVRVIGLGVYKRYKKLNVGDNKEFFDILNADKIDVDKLFYAMDNVFIDAIKDKGYYLIALKEFQRIVNSDFIKLVGRSRSESGDFTHICEKCANASCSLISAYDNSIKVKDGEIPKFASKHLGYHSIITTGFERVNEYGEILGRDILECTAFRNVESMGARNLRVHDAEEAEIKRLNDMKVRREAAKYKDYERVVRTKNGNLIKTLKREKADK